MCFIWFSEETVIMSLNKINRFFSIIEMRCVACDIEAEYSYIIQMNFVLQRFNEQFCLVNFVMFSINLTEFIRRTTSCNCIFFNKRKYEKSVTTVSSVTLQNMLLERCSYCLEL